MRRILYISSSRHADPTEDVTAFIEGARARNAANDVTGVLIFAEGTYMQLLEGPSQAVEATMERVTADQRHKGVIVLMDRQVESRLFADWSMGWRALARDHPLSDQVKRITTAKDITFQRKGDGALTDAMLRTLLSEVSKIDPTETTPTEGGSSATDMAATPERPAENAADSAPDATSGSNTSGRIAI